MELHRPVIDESQLPFFAQHDLACPVCCCNKAVLNCNDMVFEPCGACRARGRRIQQHNRAWLKIQRWFSRNGDTMRFFLVVLVLSLASILFTGCPKPCTPKTARCLGNVTQLCRPDKHWQPVVNCSKIDPQVPWNCVQVDPQTCRCRKPTEPARP
jgi:hypothetical protein